MRDAVVRNTLEARWVLEHRFVQIHFSYPDGPFHNRFSWDAATHAWTFLMEAEGKDGKRTFFGEDTAKRR
jgi:hypothetical protein